MRLPLAVDPDAEPAGRLAAERWRRLSEERRTKILRELDEDARAALVWWLAVTA